MRAALLSEPRWVSAARALISGCVDLRRDDDAVALLELVCRRLGDDLYPAFLRVLAEVGRRGDHVARSAVARALVLALRSGRLPSGRLGTWGAHSDPLRLASGRSLGPLEYLCAWLGQADMPVEQQRREFLDSAEAIMLLVEADDEARALYCEKLQAEANDPLEGAWSRRARDGMKALASAWSRGEPAAVAAQGFVAQMSDGRRESSTWVAWAAPLPGR